MDFSELFERLPQVAAGYAVNLLAAIAIFVVGKWVSRRAVSLGEQLMERRGFDATVVGFIANIAFVLLLTLVIIAALGQLGVPTAQFVAIIGAAGLAIGLALQGSLSNFASGVLLVSFRPARVGDYIEAAGVAGTVEDISVFSTTLLTPDRRTITVPNAKLLDGPIVNFSASETRRLDLTVSIAYEADVVKAKEILTRLVEEDPRVLKEPTPRIGVLELADSSVQIALRPWVRNEDYLPVRFDMLEAVKRELDRAGINIPYPQMDVHLPAAS